MMVLLFIDKHVDMPVIDDEETLILEEENRSKMSKKEKDPKAIDYVKLNRLSKYFGKRFVPQQELLAEQAFWYHMSNPSTKSSDASPVKMEAPKELPKVSFVNESLKKLKFYLAKFYNVVKIRTTLDARTEELLLENDQLLQQNMSQDVLLTVMNSMSLNCEYVNIERKRNESCDKCFNLDAELLKTQYAHNDLLKNESCDNQNALEISEYFENNDLKSQLQDKDTIIYLKAQIQDKVFVITSLKNDLRKVKGKEIIDIAAQIPSANTVVPGMFKLDLDPLAPSAKKVAVTPKKYVKKVRFAEPLTSSSNIKHVELSTTSDSNTSVLSPTGLKCSTSNCGSKPTGNTKNDRISQTLSRNMKNKVEAQHRKVNKKNRVVEPIRDVDVKHSLLKANSKLICATYKKSMFDGVYDMCLLDFVENVNSCAKSVKKHKKQNIWKSTGHVFTEVGLKWKPTGRIFTIVGNSFPLTRSLQLT
ncbi:hypothetical protein Tco_0946135 [Tanacetum coccineum]